MTKRRVLAVILIANACVFLVAWIVLLAARALGGLLRGDQVARVRAVDDGGASRPTYRLRNHLRRPRGRRFGLTESPS